MEKGGGSFQACSQGRYKSEVASPGFKAAQQELEVNGSRPARLGTTLEIGGVTETVTVASGAFTIDSVNRVDEQVRKKQLAQLNAPSQNVFNLQRRVAGILPVRVDVPRSGKVLPIRSPTGVG